MIPILPPKVHFEFTDLARKFAHERLTTILSAERNHYDVVIIANFQTFRGNPFVGRILSIVQTKSGSQYPNYCDCSNGLISSYMPSIWVLCWNIGISFVHNMAGPHSFPKTCKPIDYILQQTETPTYRNHDHQLGIGHISALCYAV